MSMSMKRAAATVLAAAATCLAAGATSASAALPVIYNFPTALAVSAANPGGTPAGANVPCTPSAAHPRPVVLVNGTFANQIISWNAFSPLLKNNGYCVYTFNYGGPLILGQIGSYGPVAASAGVATRRRRPASPHSAARGSTTSMSAAAPPSRTPSVPARAGARLPITGPWT